MTTRPNRKHEREIERLTRMLEAERERAEKAWSGYREALYKQVDAEMRLEEIEKILRGEE
jgi:hypothetical protein